MEAKEDTSRPRMCFFTGYMDLFQHAEGRLADGLYGSEIALVYLARQLMETYDIYVTSMSPYPAQTMAGNFRYVPLAEAERLAGERPFDVMVVWRYLHYFMVAPARRMARRTVLWLHDIYPLPWWESKALPANGRALFLNALPYMDRVVVLGAWHRDRVCREYGLAPGDVPFAIIGNGMLDPVVHAPPLPRVPHRFLWVSQKERGLAEFLAFFPRVRAMLPGAELHVFREVPPELAHDRPDYVRFRGHVPNTQVVQEMQQADYWLYPTHFDETYCISALEAQMAGCICIASACGALVETLGGPRTDRAVLLHEAYNTPAFWDEVCKAIAAVEASPTEKRRMRERAHEWALGQTWGRRKQEWYDLLGTSRKK